MTRGNKMTLTQRRIQATEQAISQPVTSESSRKGLTSCGVLTKKGGVAKPYDRVIIKKK